jgi:hypothetical protein
MFTPSAAVKIETGSPPGAGVRQVSDPSSLSARTNQVSRPPSWRRLDPPEGHLQNGQGREPGHLRQPCPRGLGFGHPVLRRVTHVQRDCPSTSAPCSVIRGNRTCSGWPGTGKLQVSGDPRRPDPVVPTSRRLDTRLSDGERAAIAEAYRDGIPSTALCRQYKLGKSTVLKILAEAGVTLAATQAGTSAGAVLDLS